MTLFFNQYGAGFSETFFHPSDDPATLQSTIVQGYYQLAVNFRHTSVILKAARFSKTNTPKKSVLWIPTSTAQGTRYSTEEPGPDAVSTTAVYRLAAANGKRRNIWCRGLADIDVRRDAFGNDLESATLKQMRNDYFLATSGYGFCIGYDLKPPEGALVWTRVPLVVAGSFQAATRTKLRLPVGVPFTAGQVVQFKGIDGTLPGFPRKAQVIEYYAGGLEDPYILIAYGLPGGVSVAPAKLAVSAVSFDTALITRWTFSRFGEHKTGRAFGSLRGRVRTMSRAR
jgi:uncharacterized protein Usg